MPDFKEKWLAVLGTEFELRPPYDPDQLEMHIKAFIRDAVWELMGDEDLVSLREKAGTVHIGQSADAVDTIVYERIFADKSRFQTIDNGFRRTRTALENLLDRKKEEVRADMLEKVRFLIFRIALAISLAAVVMTTYAIAGRWGIPMPMLRIPMT